MISQELIATYDENVDELFQIKVEEKLQYFSQILEDLYPWQYNKRNSRLPSWKYFLLDFLSRFSAGSYTGYMSDVRKGTIDHVSLMRVVCFSYVIKTLSLNAPFSFVLYRGITMGNSSHIDILRNSLESGELWSSQGFMSCSYNRDFAVEFSKSFRGKDFVMEIKVKEGLDFMPYNMFSNYGGAEGEIIFPINSKFIIHAIDDDEKVISMEYVGLSPTLIDSLETFVEYVDVEKNINAISIDSRLTNRDKEMLNLILA